MMAIEKIPNEQGGSLPVCYLYHNQHIKSYHILSSDSCHHLPHAHDNPDTVEYLGFLTPYSAASHKSETKTNRMTLKCFPHYRQVSNIRGTLVSNKIVDHSDVVGASPVGTAPTTSSFST